MREHDLTAMLMNKFDRYVKDMQEIYSDREPVAQHNDQKLFLKVLSSGDKTDNPIAKISFMMLEEGRIRNKDDKENVRDTGEFTVATIIPADAVPVPICAMEISFHFGKYLQCRAELPPLSTNEAYRDTFCKPVQQLRQGLENLPGLSPQVSLPGLEDFSSGGLMAGHIDPAKKETVIQWFLDYADLYLSFIDRRDTYEILGDPSVLQEAKAKKAAFCGMFKKMTPSILADLPDLYADDLAGKLGELLF